MQSERLIRQVGTIQALLNAQDRLTRADANQNQAMLDYQLALKDLYYSMGVKNYALN
jgi:outer membrane protein